MTTNPYLTEASEKAAQCAQMLASDVRQTHGAACVLGGPMELLWREVIADTQRLADRLRLLADFAAPESP